MSLLRTNDENPILTLIKTGKKNPISILEAEIDERLRYLEEMAKPVENISKIEKAISDLDYALLPIGESAISDV